MLFYYAAITWAYILIILHYTKSKILIFFFSIPLVVFATYRGYSGIDTPIYIARFNNYSGTWWQNFSIDSEPFFNFIIGVSKVISSDDPAAFFFCHSVLVVALFSFIVKKYDISRPYLLTVGVVFLIDGLTNVMRVTLAYHAFAICILYGLNRFKYLLPLMHITSVIALGLSSVFYSVRQYGTFRLVLYIIIALVTVIGVVFLVDLLLAYMPRVSHKLAAYQTMSAASSYSGISDIYIILCLLVVAIFHNVTSNTRRFIGVIFAVLLCILLFLLPQISLAFIRVFKYLILVICFSPYILRPQKKIRSYIFLLIGIPYTLNFMRQIVTSHGFLPYGNF